MLGVHKSIEISQASEYAKEMRKWETEHSRYGPPGRQRVFAEFPKRLYKADWVDGKAIAINQRCSVNDADEQRNMESRGFHADQQAALDAAHRLHFTEYGKLAAERNYEIEHGRIGPRAAAEVRAAEAEHGAKHLPDVPEKKRRPYVRKPKPEQASDEQTQTPAPDPPKSATE